MAKTRQQNSIEAAILKVTAAMKIDAIANPTEEQKQERETAMLEAADVIENSGIITLAEHGDDTIETAHQVDAVFEEAGINPVEFKRAAALENANSTVAAAAIEGDQQMAEIEAAEQDQE